MTRNPFNGIRIIESVYAEVQGEPYPVVRTWRERWLTRPWRPWKATRMVTPMVPTAYETPMGIIAHPAIVKQLREQFGRTP